MYLLLQVNHFIRSRNLIAFHSINVLLLLPNYLRLISTSLSHILKYATTLSTILSNFTNILQANLLILTTRRSLLAEMTLTLGKLISKDGNNNIQKKKKMERTSV